MAYSNFIVGECFQVYFESFSVKIMSSAYYLSYIFKCTPTGAQLWLSGSVLDLRLKCFLESDLGSFCLQYNPQKYIYM